MEVHVLYLRFVEYSIIELPPTCRAHASQDSDKTFYVILLWVSGGLAELTEALCFALGFVGNETFERLATFGLLANFMVYLLNKFHLNQVKATNVLNIWNGTTNFAPLVGAFISDSYVGRFWTIAFASFASLLVRVLLLDYIYSNFDFICLLIFHLGSSPCCPEHIFYCSFPSFSAFEYFCKPMAPSTEQYA